MTFRSTGLRASLAAIGLAASMAVLRILPEAPARVAAQDLGTEAQRESGKKLYLKFCAQCHNENGNGEGHAAPHLRPRPRNFTTGKFKIRTTPNGALPTHQDLVNVIRRGMPYTSMPAWPDFSDQEVSDLAWFLTTFSQEFSNPANAPKAVPLPDPPKSSEASIEAGKKLYEETGCGRCHGTLGRGDGPSAPTLKDDWGNPIRAADLTQNWTFRGGSSREDIFRTMSTGLNGTPMPSFLDALQPEQRWAITDFVYSLSGGAKEAGYANLVVAAYSREPIDLAKGAASFASAPAARFPIVGQIMEPGRSFHPPASSVVVQAIYDAQSVAILVRWHDMSAQTTGKNGPSLPVPMEEEEEAAGTPGEDGGGAGGGAFGDAEVAPAPEGQAAGAQPPGGDPFAEAAPAAGASEFSDAVAVQIPSQIPAGARKPYFIFGDADNSVDLWFFDLAGKEPQTFIGRGSGAITPGSPGELTGVAHYDQGEWSVIFKRPRQSASGPAFSPGEFMPVAFSVWDGFSRERGNRRGLTLWYALYLGPEVVPSAAGPMLKTALAILALEVVVIGWVRRRSGRRTRGELDGEPTQPAATGA